jgi:flavin reductase (DIM6/NTAB) family NADH-FMN oxidoreductase RutF
VELDPETATTTALYKLMIGSVVPRPIAWVSSVDAAGVRNLAPFSYFMAIGHEPPTIAFSVGPRGGDTGGGVVGKKDTLANVEALREWVVNVVDDDTAERMNITSGDYGADVDEFELARLTPAPSMKVKPPRVAEAPINMECRLRQIVPVGKHTLVIGDIVHFHVRDDVFDAKTGRIDMHKLRPLGRLAGNMYSHINAIFEMKRPSDTYIG